MIRVNTTEYKTLYALTDETPIRIGVIIPEGTEPDALLEEITDNIDAIELDGAVLDVGKNVVSNHLPEYPYDITERANVLEIYLADADYQDPEEIAEIKQSEWDAVAAKQEETNQAIAEAAEQQEANKTDLELALAEAVERQEAADAALAEARSQQAEDKTNFELALAEAVESQETAKAQQEEDYTNLELALAEAVEKQTVTEQALADEVAAHEETKKALSDVQAQQDADKTNLELAIAELTETVCSFQETAADTDLDQTAATDTSAVDTTDIAPAEPAEGAEA